MNGMQHFRIVRNGRSVIYKMMIGAAILLLSILAACSFADSAEEVGNSDWSYDLPNDYAIWHVNSRNIVCGKKRTPHSISDVGGTYVTQFCYNSQYVCLQCADVPSDLSEEIDTSNPDYYIIDTNTDAVNGPLKKEAFEELLDSMDPEEFTPWIQTKPMPMDARFS